MIRFGQQIRGYIKLPLDGSSSYRQAYFPQYEAWNYKGRMNQITCIWRACPLYHSDSIAVSLLADPHSDVKEPHKLSEHVTYELDSKKSQSRKVAAAV